MSTLLHLRKDEERRLRTGHVWIYSNEIDITRSPLRGLEPGQAVEIMSSRGQWLGHAYVNPNTLIAARIVSRDREHPLDRSLIVHRLNIALALRERLYPQPSYRLVHGEADGLPGLVVDRYGDVLVAQLTTAGMDRMREAVIEALDQVLRPKAIILRNDVNSRTLEGLQTGVEVAFGEAPDHLVVHEGAARFEVPALEGQKTGWFHDQAANREQLTRYAQGRTVLDVFSYAGAWSIRAALAGATTVTAVDASERALDWLTANAARNGVEDRVSTLRGDAFEVLRALRAEGKHFDIVVLDPPAFIKRRKDAKEGQLAYRRLHDAALTLLSRDGLLVSASCSHHFAEEDLLRTAQAAARANDRSLQCLATGHAGPDHPVHPAMPETAYLKAFFLRVLPTF